jgi:hypothetical protein
MRSSSRALVVLTAVSFVLASAGVSSAGLPSTKPGNTFMVNGPVRAIAQDGGNNWIGGKFTEVLDQNRSPVQAVSDLAAFSGAGTLAGSVHLASFTDAAVTPVIYDMSLGPDGRLYIAGAFDHVDGQVRHNVAAIDPVTGTLLAFAPSTNGTSKAILATASAIYVGNGKLLSFQLNGSPTPGYVAPTVSVNPSYRVKKIAAEFRDIVVVGSTLVAACQCDGITDRHGHHRAKAAVKIHAATGDVFSWTPAKLLTKSAAFGIIVKVRNFPGTKIPTVYLGAGGNDFVAAYGLPRGTQRWREDVSGSAQALAWWRGNLVVGGHFDWSQRPRSGDCGSDARPNRRCYHTPKLLALGARIGRVLLNRSGRPWNPGICCAYNGIWTLMTGVNGKFLRVGGEFARAGGTWSYNALKHRWEIKNAAFQDNYTQFGT